MYGCGVLGRLAGALAIVLISGSVRAATLAYHAPNECATADGLREQVERLTGRALREVNDAEFSVRVEGPEHHLWRATLSARIRDSDQPGQREFSGKTCGEVTDAAAVAIAMAIDQETLAADSVAGTETEAVAGPSNAGSPTSSRAAAGVAPQEPQTAPGVARAAAPSVRMRAVLLGVVDAGALPNASPGGELDLGVGVGQAYILLLGSVLTPQTRTLPSGKGGEFQLVVGGALACGERSFGRLAGNGCVGFELGRISAEGMGVTHPRVGSAAWRAARVDLGLAWPLGYGVAITARGTVSVPWSRQHFVLDGTERVYRPAPLSVRGMLGFNLEI